MSSSGSSVRLAWLVIQLLVLSLLGVAVAREAPQNLVDFYNAVRAKGRCSHELATGFYSRDGGPNSTPFLPPMNPPRASLDALLTLLQPSPTAATPSPPRACSTSRAATARSPTWT
jgi:hypothetical protein